MAEQSQSSTSGNELGFFIVLTVLAIGLYFIVQIFEEAFISGWRYLRIFELAIFIPFDFIPSFVPVFGQLQIIQSIQNLWAADASQLRPEHLRELDTHYARYFSYFPALFLVYMAVRQSKRTISTTKRFDEESILRHFAPLYPHIHYAMETKPQTRSIDLDRRDADSYIFAMALHPDEFARMNPPLQLEGAAKRNKAFRRPILRGDSDFDSDLATRTFEAQLRQRFVHINDMRPIEYECYKIFRERLSPPRKEVVEWLNKYAKTAFADLTGGKRGKGMINPNRLDAFSYPMYEYTYHWLRAGIIEIVGKPKKRKVGKGKDAVKKEVLPTPTKEQLRKIRTRWLVTESLMKLSREPKMADLAKTVYAQHILHSHGYVITGLMEMLERARNTGVLHMGEIEWVKRNDRALWYALHNVGRRVAFAEGAGPYAHWEMERIMERPLRQPHVQEAVAALERHLGFSESEEDEARRAEEKNRAYANMGV